MSDEASGTVDLTECEKPRNMYGCLSCPKCGGEHRASYRGGRSAGMVACDDCGFHEPAIWLDDES